MQRLPDGFYHLSLLPDSMVEGVEKYIPHISEGSHSEEDCAENIPLRQLGSKSSFSSGIKKGVLPSLLTSLYPTDIIRNPRTPSQDTLCFLWNLQ